MSPTLPAAQWLLSVVDLLAIPRATNASVLSTAEQPGQPSRALTKKKKKKTPFSCYVHIHTINNSTFPDLSQLYRAYDQTKNTNFSSLGS